MEQTNSQSQNGEPASKRKADGSQGRNEKGVKRSALGNVTNALVNAIEKSQKNVVKVSSGQLLPVPDGVIDFDRENSEDPLQVSDYAMDIFNYLKERETTFKIDAYLERQPYLNCQMRRQLVNWMIRRHGKTKSSNSALHLAVKIVDIYLTKVTLLKEHLPLIGAAAMFMAIKYEVSE